MLFSCKTFILRTLMDGIFRIAPNFLSGALHLIGHALVRKAIISNRFANALLYFSRYLIELTANLI
ncbi:hypothetical protein ACPOL_5940 [Acidisarcina polymorpha]|uniref:Uncharacterized protein n=1 Tax=Acidisarcina polymorpha TaxID=2211140 RepID=A0A2Z5G923_9BACT|nr:hypothetical protein ACPOL_5940 [Acidisarcina polymorpha]